VYTKYLLYLLLLAINLGSAKAQLMADFSADQVSGCAPIRVAFSDKSTGTNSSTEYRWDLGNGTIAVQTKSPSVVYLEPGTYTVKLTINNGADSASITKTAFITAFAVPKLEFSGSTLTGCSPMKVLFQDASTAMSGEMTSWKWDFGDGVLGTGQNPTHVYESSGNYKVTLIAENSKGCSNFFSKANYIKVHPPSQVKFSTLAPATCTVPATFTFTNKSTGAPISKYTWFFGDGSVSNEENPTHTYLESGNYTVKLVTQNNTGCKDSMVANNVVNAASQHADFYSVNSVCEGISASFFNMSTPANLPQTYYWDFGNGQTSTLKNPAISFSKSGTYAVKLIANIGGCPDTTVREFYVLPKPEADFSALTTGACKPPLQAQFNNTSQDGKVVKWYFGNGDSSIAENPSVLYNDFGSYDVALIVRSAAGCYDTVTKASFIEVKEPAAVAITGLPRGGCVPFTDTFHLEYNSPDTVVKYEWDFGDKTYSDESTPIHTYDSVGVYNVAVKITTAGGCTDTISSTISGGVKPKANFERTPNIVCPQDYVKFTSLASELVDAWEWSFGDGGRSTLENPVHMYQDTGWMTVKLVVFDKGCPDSIEYKQHVYVKPPIAKIIDSFSCTNQFQHQFTSKDAGAKTWQWSINDKVVFEGKIFTYNFPEVGNYKLRLHVTNELCYDNATITVKVLNEKAAFTVKEPVDCQQPFIQFRAAGVNTHPENIREYRWDFGDSTATVITKDSLISHHYARSGTVNVKLVITDLNGCVDSCLVPVKVGRYGPVANFGPILTNVCAGNKVTFYDSSLQAGYGTIVKWDWDFGDGTRKSFSSSPFSHVYSKSGVYDVRLIIENEAGCKDTLLRQRTVVVFKPVANFNSPDTVICVNAPARFINLSNGYGLRSSWHFGDGNSSANNNSENKYNKAGLYDVKLVVTDSQNCSDSLFKPKYILVADARAIFNVSDTFSACPPLLVNFSNKSVNNFTNSWDFGNGNSSELASPAHTYTLAGIFDVKLKVVGNGGCVDSAYKQIQIQGPSGTFSYNPLYQCIPLAASFNSETLNATKITWDFSDGNTLVGGGGKTSHVYKHAGAFVPRLILTDDKGCQVPIQGRDTIKTFDIKTSIKSLPSNFFCDSAVVHFFDSTITEDVITNYLWDFGDGMQSAAQNPVHLYKNSGIQRVRFSVETLGGCKAGASLAEPVVVSVTPVVEIKVDSTICLSQSLKFEGVWKNKDTSKLTYKWGFGNSTSSLQLQPLPVRYEYPGRYTVNFAASNKYGCTGSFSTIVRVNDTPRIIARYRPFICLGDTVQLKLTGANKYKWTTNTVLSCNDCASPVIRPNAPHNYAVTGTDENGCQASIAVFVNVKAPRHLKVSAGDTLCIGESLQLQAAGTELYNWLPITGLSSGSLGNTLATPTVSTQYMVVGSDSLGCFHDTGYINIVVYPIPEFDILQHEIVAATGTQIVLHTSSSADIIRWRWQPAIGLSCSNCAEPTTTVKQVINYSAIVENGGGCKSQDQVSIIPVCNTDNIFVPNTFSPNGDGKNDVFYPRGKGLARIKSMRIFSRWGEMLYEKKDFAPNDEINGWKGTYKGAKLPPDVYIYIIEVICDNNTVITSNGNITLLK
jgi:gliding motility-associated-like protein